MFLDNKLTFNSAVGTAQTLTTTADSTGIIDVTGAGVGVVPHMINGFPASSSALGSDWGAGDGVAIPHVYVSFPTVGVSSNTITISVKAAPDNGSGAEGTYTTLVSTPAIAESVFTAGDIVDIQLPPIHYTEGEALPRFYKLTYTMSAAVTMTAQANLVLNPTQGLLGGQYAKNFISV